MKRCLAALFVALVAFPTVASAVPPDNVRRHWAPPPQARGTDVAAPDQQASQPAPPPASSSDEFDWADAGVGAIAGSALAAFAIAGAVGMRRRPATRLAG